MQKWKLPTFKVSDKSLFAILSRSPFWASFLIVAALLALAQIEYFERIRLMLRLLALPFCVTGLVSLWKRRHLPSASLVEKTIGDSMSMTWKDFSSRLEASLQCQGYEVARCSGAADFEIEKGGRRTLIACRRWKAASHGQEPLRELVAARDARDARDARYICVNALTENAMRYAEQNKIHLVRSEELTQWLCAASSQMAREKACRKKS